jgi:hypothetical protein
MSWHERVPGQLGRRGHDQIVNFPGSLRQPPPEGCRRLEPDTAPRDGTHRCRHTLSRVEETALRMARDLDELGLWVHLRQDDRVVERARVARGGYPFNPGALVDWIFVDSDVIAEGTGKQVLDELAPLLVRFGVDLGVEVVVDGGQATLIINGIVCEIWTAADPYVLDRENFTEWPFGVVNQLLEAAGAVVRVHLLYAGTNFGLAHLLDPRIPGVVAASGLYPEWEIPSLAHPRGGRPQPGERPAG